MKSIILSGSALLFTFLVSKYIFGPTNLFYEIWWLDIPMHVWGGFLSAWFAGACIKYWNQDISYTAVILSFLVIAFVWEVYEYIIDTKEYLSKGFLDTVADIINGVLGATAWYFLLKK